MLSTPLAALVSILFHRLIIPLLAFVLLLVPLVAASLINLRRHTVAQVTVGALIGPGLTALQLQL
jgi:membrane-associated phospholipid phosphatase